MNTAQVVIIVISVIIVFMAVLLFTGVIGPKSDRQDPNAEVVGHLAVWGTEPKSTFSKSFALYKEKQRIEIDYTEVSPGNFNEDFVRAIARGQGPDLVIQDNTWIGAHTEFLSPAPPEKVAPIGFKNAFVDAASKAFTKNDKIWALPL